jgi:hypothetical protein
VRAGDRAGSGPADAAYGLALLHLGRATLCLGHLPALRAPAARASRLRALARIATLRADPDAAAEALAELAVAEDAGHDAPVLHAAAIKAAR